MNVYYPSYSRARLIIIVIIALLINLLLLGFLFLPQINLEIRSFFNATASTDSFALIFDTLKKDVEPSVQNSRTMVLPPLAQQQSVQQKPPSDSETPPPDDEGGAPTLRSGDSDFGSPSSVYKQTAPMAIFDQEGNHEVNATQSSEYTTQNDMQEGTAKDDIEHSEKEEASQEKKALEEKDFDTQSTVNNQNSLEKIRSEKQIRRVQGALKKTRASEHHDTKNESTQNLTFEALARGFIKTLNRGGAGFLDRDGDGSTVASQKDLILQRYLERLIWIFQHQVIKETFPTAVIAYKQTHSQPLIVGIKLVLYDNGIVDQVEVIDKSAIPAFDDMVMVNLRKALFSAVPEKLLNGKRRFETTMAIYG